MGYTHTYRIYHLDLDLRVPEVSSDIRRLIKHSNVPIGDYEGKPGSRPKLGHSLVSFNGIGEDSAETFAFPPSKDHPHLEHDPGRSFCKTYRKPYDIIVAAALIAIKHHLSDNVVITSDGNFSAESEWLDAYSLYTNTTGRDLPEFFSRYEPKFQTKPLSPPSPVQTTMPIAGPLNHAPAQLGFNL